jgi:hypothetical protein
MYDAENRRFMAKDIVEGVPEIPQTLNRYPYVINNPKTLIDPSGKWLIIDDIVAIVAGALFGAFSQYVGDVLENVADGKTGLSIFKPKSSWESYVGSIFGGAFGGWVTLYSGPIAGAAAFGGIGTLTTQTLEKLTGTNDRSNEEILLNTATATIFSASFAGALNRVGKIIQNKMLGRANPGQNAPPIKNQAPNTQGTGSLQPGTAGIGIGGKTGQLTQNACGMASGQRLLAEEGITVFQSNLSRGFYKGLTPSQLASNMNQHSSGWVGHMTYLNEKQLLNLYSSNGKFIVRFGGNPGHFVTVESVTSTTVKYWDPSGGVYKNIPTKDFTDIVSGLVYKTK